MKASLALVATLLLATVSPAQADDSPMTRGVIEATGLGTVDMSRVKNRIQAKLLAKRAATVDAQRNLLEMIEGVRVTSGTTVKDAQLESDLVANRVKGLLQGAFIVKEDVSEDGGDFLAEVTLGVCLNADDPACQAKPTLAQIVYPTLKKTGAEDRFEAPATTDTMPSKATGLIVDATGIDFEPFFDVRLVTSQGKEVYGPGNFDINAGDDWLHWSRSVDAARDKSSVVGDSPLVVTAQSLKDDTRVVLANDDAATIFRANLENDDFLRKGKVIFVVK
ncbi:MAG: hypothetical protein KDI19_13065 [Pseudomonadales bacterium]|nr:hypothetical protein [Pseudomonadales bacterium]